MNLSAFVQESNAIEGITRDPTPAELIVTEQFLQLRCLILPAVVNLVNVYAPGARLRDVVGLNVMVGRHGPPRGGPHIRQQLEYLLADIDRGKHTPYSAHATYETLHPFMDGNGRSGRAVWAWMMYRAGRDPFAMEFLRRWYYDSLNESRR